MNRSFIRNLIIIILLIFAIGIVNEKVTAKKRWVEEEKAKAAREEAEAKALKEKMRLEARAASGAQNNEPLEAGNSSGNLTEDPQASLLRLQGDLKSGLRNEYPKGSVQIGNSHFYLVAKPMSWTDAMAYANEYGARLAILENLDDGQKIISNMSNPEGCWLGAGDHGNGVYTWVDGSKWDFDSSLQVKNTFLVLNSFGKLEPGRANKKLPFLMEWTQSDKVKGSLDSLVHTFDPRLSPLPVGSIRMGKQAYFVMPWKGKPADAAAFANQMGGWLATAGSPEEMKLLHQLTRYRIELGKRVMIGGVARDGKWGWGNGEAWRLTDLSLKAPVEGEYLGILSAQEDQCAALSDSEEIAYMIIEWGEKPTIEGGGALGTSSKPNRVVQMPKENPEVVEEMRQLRSKLKTANGTLEKFDKSLKDNAQDLRFDLRAWLRGLPKTQKDEAESIVAKVEKKMKEDYIEQIIEASMLPETAYAIYQNHLKSQDKIISDRLGEVKKIQDAYRSLIDGRKKLALEKKNKELVEAFDRELQRCEGDTEDFLKFMKQ